MATDTPTARENRIREVFAEHIALAQAMDALTPQIREAADIVTECLANGGVVMLAGNGGSAADAQHIAGEFVGRFLQERKPLPALALHTNTTVMTAIGNDYSFDLVYARQVAAHARPGDVFIGITTSGNSPNILEAAKKARECGMKVLGLTGASGGKLKELCDLCLCIPSPSTPRIQEMHIVVGHLICELAEANAC